MRIQPALDWQKWGSSVNLPARACNQYNVERAALIFTIDPLGFCAAVGAQIWRLALASRRCGTRAIERTMSSRESGGNRLHNRGSTRGGGWCKWRERTVRFRDLALCAGPNTRGR